MKNVAKMFSSPPCDRKIQPGLTCKGGELAENVTKGFSALSSVATTAGCVYNRRQEQNDAGLP